MIRRLWDKWFRGHQGFVGPKGDHGEPGYLQLSGFPSGTQICLYDDRNRLVWYGDLKRVSL